MWQRYNIYFIFANCVRRAVEMCLQYDISNLLRIQYCNCCSLDLYQNKTLLSQTGKQNSCLRFCFAINLQREKNEMVTATEACPLFIENVYQA